MRSACLVNADRSLNLPPLNMNGKSGLLRVLCVLASMTLAAPAKIVHVSVDGSNANEGSQAKPLRTIQRAADAAQPGDTIVVHEGVYREHVNPPRGGTTDKKRIVYQAAKGEKAELKGSEVIKGWHHLQNDTWKVVIPNTFFAAFNPYKDVIHGEWYKTPEDGYDRHTGAVYLNGHWLTEAASLEPVLEPTQGKSLWFGQVDEKNTTIWAQFKGADPNRELVEINVRQSIFYPDKPGRNYITVRGFTMTQAATPWSGAMSEQIGLVGTHWSKGWIIEDNDISYSVNTGVTLGRYEADWKKLPPETEDGFTESIRKALEDGWSKETVGGHVVRNNRIAHCEKNGIHGSLGGVFSTIEGNTIHDIAMEGWGDGFDKGAIKLLGSFDTIIRRNHVYRTGYWGIWLDWMAQGAAVDGNLLHDNEREDLFFEVNHGPVLVANNISLSPKSLLDASSGDAYAHNLFAGKLNQRKPDARSTPFFRPHTTELTGRQEPFYCGHERFFNNVFVHHGIAHYSACPDIRIDGNVFLGKAAASKQEACPLVSSGYSTAVSLIEKQGCWYLQVGLDPAWRNQQRRPLVTTDLLGMAVTPQARFEKPDGSPLRIDRDYFGQRRDKDNPFPGPFEHPRATQTVICIWPIK